MFARFFPVSLLLVSALISAPSARAGQCAQTESFRLAASDGFHHQGFGYDVSLSDDWIAVGARGALADGDGAAYVYTRGPVFQEVKISPPDLGIGGEFGFDVETDGDWLSISEPKWNDDRGRVHLYHYDGALWNPVQIIEGTEVNGEIGRDVSIDADAGLMVIGKQFLGEVEIFGLSSGNWSSKRTLKPPFAGGNFGRSVAIDGNRLAVSAIGDNDSRGAVYVYEGSGILWAMIDKLVAPDLEPDDKFGFDLAMAGDHLLVGTPDYDGSGAYSGAVFPYSFAGTEWVAQPFLIPASSQSGDVFGYSVAMDGDIAVVYSVSADAPNGTSGAVFQYRRQGNLWVEQQMLYIEDVTEGEVTPPLDIHDGLVVIADTGAAGLGGEPGAVFGFSPIESLALGVTPSEPSLGENVFFDTCGGAPGNATALYAVAADGIPLFVGLFPGSFDASGGWGVFVPYNAPGLAGHNLDLQAFGIDAGGKIRASNVANLAFQ